MARKHIVANPSRGRTTCLPHYQSDDADTLQVPPVGVWCVAGCGADLCINILLTILGYIPGHIHAFYVEYVHYERLEQARIGAPPSAPAQGVYSDRVQQAGGPQEYGTINPGQV